MPSATDAFAYPPRLLGAEAAARYIGISPSKFAELVAAGRAPKPAKLDARSLWDRHQLDAFADDLIAARDTSPRDEFLRRFPKRK